MNDAAGIIAIVIIGLIIILVLSYICSYKCFKKAGVEGWKAFIPIYNNYMYSMIATGDEKLSWKYVIISSLTSTLNLWIRSYTSSITSSSGNFHAAYAFAMLLLLVFIGLSGVNLVLSIQISYKFAKAYGKSDAFAVGYVLLGIIFMPILAFDPKAEYCGPLKNSDHSDTNDDYDPDRKMAGYDLSSDHDVSDSTAVQQNIYREHTVNADNAITEKREDQPDRWDWFFK